MIRRLAFELRYLLGQTPWDTGVSPPELMAFLDAHPPGRSLDLGCGTGTNAMTMAGRGWEVTAIDFSLQAIRCARRRFKHAGMTATLALGDVAAMSAAQGVYQLALDIGCLHGLAAERKSVYAANLKRHLAPGGTYLLYALLARPSPRWRPRHVSGGTSRRSLPIVSISSPANSVRTAPGLRPGSR